jgi:hypothetical protein
LRLAIENDTYYKIQKAEMALVVYTKLKELQIQEKEIFEFGNWLRSFVNESAWEDDDEYSDDSYSEDVETPVNADGDVMEYPWDDFSYVVVPDSNDEVEDAAETSRMLGVSIRFDVYDMGKVFFVVK